MRSYDEDALNNPCFSSQLIDSQPRSPQGTWSRSIVEEKLRKDICIIAIDPGTTNIHAAIYIISPETGHKTVFFEHENIYADNSLDMIMNVKYWVETTFQSYFGDNKMDCPVTLVTESQFTANMKAVWAAVIASSPRDCIKLSIAPQTIKAHFKHQRDREHPGEEGRPKRYAFNKKIALDYVNENAILDQTLIKDHNEADCILMIQYVLDNKL